MRFAVLDTETTGVKPGDRVIELAAGIVEDGVYVESQRWQLNPAMPIPAGASEVHGYTDDMVANWPPFTAQMAADLLTLLSSANGPVYVHNVAFDLDAILLPEFARVGADGGSLAALPWSCTLKMARELWPGEANDLGAVAARLGVEFDGAAHSAAVDVDVLRRIVEQIVHRYAYRSHRGALAKQATPAMVAAPASTDELLVLAGGKATPFLARVKAAQDWAAGYLCADDEDEALGHQALASVKRVQAEAEAERRSVVEPVKVIGAKIDALFRENIAKPCDVVRVSVEQRLASYAAAKLQAQRAAEAEARRKLEVERAEAKRVADAAALAQLELDRAEAKRQADAAAAELAARRAGDAVKLAELQAAQREAELLVAAERAKLQAAQADQAAVVQDALALVVSASEPGAGPVKVSGASGGYKLTLVARIVDPAKVPDIYWAPSLEAVQRAVEQGAREIAGVVIDEIVGVQNRRRG